MSRHNESSRAWVLSGLFILGVFGFLQSLKAPERKFIQNAVINFVAARPTSILSIFDFDFDAREVVRSFENPFDKKENKKRDVAQKKADVKAETAKAKLTADAQKKAQEAKAKNDKRAQVTVDVVGGSESSGLTGSDIDKKSNLAIDDNGGSVAAVNNESIDGTTAGKEERSGAQWRALISAEPTEANFKLLAEAYLKGEIEDGPFFSIISESLKSSNEATQGFALNALDNVVSPKAFIVVINSEKSLSAANKAKSTQVLNSFGTFGKLNTMSLLLNFPDTNVVTQALRAFTQGYLTAKDKGFQPATQNQAGPTSQSVQQSYSRYVNLIKRLAQSANPVVSQAAQQSLAQVDNTQVASL